MQEGDRRDVDRGIRRRKRPVGAGILLALAGITVFSLLDSGTPSAEARVGITAGVNAEQVGAAILKAEGIEEPSQSAVLSEAQLVTGQLLNDADKEPGPTGARSLVDPSQPIPDATTVTIPIEAPLTHPGEFDGVDVTASTHDN